MIAACGMNVGAWECMLGYWGAWNDWQSCVHVVAKLVLCGCASVHCAPRPTALQHAGALQSCSSCHLLVALQAMHWCYWLVLGFRVYGFGCRTVTASYMHEKHAGNLKSWCPLQGRQGTHLWGLVWGCLTEVEPILLLSNTTHELFPSETG